MPSEDLESIVYAGHSSEGAWFQALEPIGFRAVFSGQSQVLTGLASRGGGQGSGVAIAAAGWVRPWGSLAEEKYSSGPSRDSGSSALPAPQPGSALTHGAAPTPSQAAAPLPGGSPPAALAPFLPSPHSLRGDAGPRAAQAQWLHSSGRSYCLSPEPGQSRAPAQALEEVVSLMRTRRHRECR